MKHPSPRRLDPIPKRPLNCEGDMRYATIVAVVLALAGCAGPGLMPTPNIYVDGAYRLFDELDPSLRSSTIDLLYATDRAPSEHEGDCEPLEHRSHLSENAGDACPGRVHAYA